MKQFIIQVGGKIGGLSMSTRGAYGFYKDNTNKITYNHYDSYPSVLGKSIINFIVNTTDQEMEKIFQSIKLMLLLEQF